MSRIHVRLAEVTDSDSILQIFLKQFPFLQKCQEKARKDIVFRITEDSSFTAVAVHDEEVVGVARGHENKGIYLMDSICTLSTSSLVYRSKIVLTMLPFYIETCIEQADRLGLSTMFYGSDTKSMARLGPVYCKLHGYRFSHGEHDRRKGFWIRKNALSAEERRGPVGSF